MTNRLCVTQSKTCNGSNPCNGCMQYRQKSLLQAMRASGFAESREKAQSFGKMWVTAWEDMTRPCPLECTGLNPCIRCVLRMMSEVFAKASLACEIVPTPQQMDVFANIYGETLRRLQSEVSQTVTQPPLPSSIQQLNEQIPQSTKTKPQRGDVKKIINKVSEQKPINGETKSEVKEK